MVEVIDPIFFVQVEANLEDAPTYAVLGTAEINPVATETTQEKKSIKKVNTQRRYSCTMCIGTFQRQDHLQRHVRSVHSNLKCCICPVCEKDCKRHDLLLKHVEKRHSDKTAFQCRECSYTCDSLSELEKHEKCHFTIKRHPCPQCNISFKRRDHMLRHIKSQHLKLFCPCPVCKQSFKRRDHVVRHLREKHGDMTIFEINNMIKKNAGGDKMILF